MSAYIDIRLPDGGHTVTNPQVGQVIDMQMWAVVNGSDSDGTNEGFGGCIGSITSANTGAGTVRGNLTDTLDPDFNVDGHGSTGTQGDLDGDGDLDIGSDNPTEPDGYLVALTLTVNTTGELVGQGSPGAGQQFHIADLQFAITNIDNGPATTISFVLRPQVSAATSAYWVEDGTTHATILGASLDPSVGVQILPEPAGMAVAALGAAVLLRRRRILQSDDNNTD